MMRAFEPLLEPLLLPLLPLLPLLLDSYWMTNHRPKD